MDLDKIKKYFTPTTILDIGANIGQFYNNCKKIFPDSYYYLIEGNNFCEEALSGLDVDFSISLLSDKVKTVDFYIRKTEPLCTGNSIYREKTIFFCDDDIKIEKRQTSTLDNLLSGKKFDLIKLDVQGSELDVMNGGLDTIKKSIGVILEVSLIEFNENSPSKKDVINFMNELGFDSVEVLGTISHPITHEIIQEDILFIQRKLNDVALITVLFDYPEYYLPPFYENSKKFLNQEDIHIVRFNNEFIGGSYYDKLFYYKIVGLLDYIKKNILGKYKYVLFLDATDTNFIGSPKEIINKFKKFNCSILFGAEYGLWPPTDFSHLYSNKRKSTDKYYLNSGTYIGYTEKIISNLDEIIEKKYQDGIDDQGKWTIQYLMSQDIEIDQECEIFFSTYLSKKDVSVNGTNIFLIGKNACIIHDNGPYGEETLKLTDLLK